MTSQVQQPGERRGVVINRKLEYRRIRGVGREGCGHKKEVGVQR